MTGLKPRLAKLRMPCSVLAADQVRIEGAAAVVRIDRGNEFRHRSDFPVHAHDRYAQRAEKADVRDDVACGEQQPIHAMAGKCRQVRRLDLRHAACVADERRVAAQAGRVIAGPHQLGEIGVEDVGNDDADDMGLAHDERTGKRVRRVVELTGKRPDLLAGLLADERILPVKDLGDGRRGDAGLPGNVLDRD